MFKGTLSLTQENRHFTVQIGKNKCSQWTKLPRTCITLYYTAHNNFQIGMRLCSLTKIFTFSRYIYKMFRGTRTPESPQKKSTDNNNNNSRTLAIFCQQFGKLLQKM
jgi:hypothetical protein